MGNLFAIRKLCAAHKQIAAGRRLPSILSLLIVSAICGCSSDSHKGFSRNGAETYLPKLTDAVSGPISVAFAHPGTFQADFTLVFGTDAQSPSRINGRMFGRQGKVRMEGAAGKPSKHPDEFGVIWDTGAGRGWAFSESLQGFAPVDAGTGLTNVAENTTEQAERREGYRVRGATISAMQSDGHAVKINLLRAPDLGGMPLEMVVSSPTASFSLTLTGIKPDAPPEQFFLSPEDFTKYDTETAMLAELLGRENSVNNGGKNRIGNASDPDWKETRRRANEAGQ